MLTDLLLSLQPRWWHLVMRLLGVDIPAFHEWLEGFCPCGHEDVEDNVAA